MRLLIALLSCLLLAVPTANAGSSRDYSAKVTADYVATPTPEPSCNGFRVTGSGSATIRIHGWPRPPTVKGKHSMAECVDLIATPGAFTGRGARFTVATPRGKLRGRYQWESGVPDSQVELHIAGTFAFAGGSGIFARAGGDGVLVAKVNVLTGNVHAVFQGTMRLPDR